MWGGQHGRPGHPTLVTVCFAGQYKVGTRWKGGPPKAAYVEGKVVAAQNSLKTAVADKTDARRSSREECIAPFRS